MEHRGVIIFWEETTKKQKLWRELIGGGGKTVGTPKIWKPPQPQTKRTTRPQKPAKTRMRRREQASLEKTTLGPLGKSQKTTRRQYPVALTLALTKQTT